MTNDIDIQMLIKVEAMRDDVERISERARAAHEEFARCAKQLSEGCVYTFHEGER